MDNKSRCFMRSPKEYRELSKTNQDISQTRYNKRKSLRLDNIKKIVARENPLVIDPGRSKVRRALINDDDSLGLERLIRGNDFLNINYLECGLEAAKSICRVEVRDEDRRIVEFGTGFMVSPTLLLTCNHLINGEDECANSYVNFNYEDDVNFIPKTIKIASFDSSSFFYTDASLDFTLVALEELTHDKTPLSEFGFLKLIEDSGKALVGESATIIQHPDGFTKQIALRENQVVDVFDHFIHYETDTAKGTSGAAVFNDQWEVVSLHHQSIMKKDDNGKILTDDDELWDESMGEDKIGWKANEGIRISSILDHLKKQDWNIDQQKYIDDLFSNIVDANHDFTISMETAEFETNSYDALEGYNKDFLGKEIKLPKLKDELVNDVTITNNNERELKYTHFSIIMSKSRCLPFYTAVNIDGKKAVKIKRENDKWYYDSRIDKKYQYGPELYVRNDLDRGHIIRRLDPVWGTDTIAKRAGEDTFHFTNCAPQHKDLNRVTWLDLEDYILNNAINDDMKISVFTGPIFREEDRIYRSKYLIPSDYWKIVVFEKNNGKISATGYLQTQKILLEELEWESAYGEYKTYQVPISTITRLSKIDFSYLMGDDPTTTIESISRRTRQIKRLDDIRL